MKLVMLMILIVAVSSSLAIQLELEPRKEKIGNQRINTHSFAYEDAGKHPMMSKYVSNHIQKGNFIHEDQMPKLRRILTQINAPPSHSSPGGSG